MQLQLIHSFSLTDLSWKNIISSAPEQGVSPSSPLTNEKQFLILCSELSLLQLYLTCKLPSKRYLLTLLRTFALKLQIKTRNISLQLRVVLGVPDNTTLLQPSDHIIGECLPHSSVLIISFCSSGSVGF